MVHWEVSWTRAETLAANVELEFTVGPGRRAVVFVCEV